LAGRLGKVGALVSYPHAVAVDGVGGGEQGGGLGGEVGGVGDEGDGGDDGGCDGRDALLAGEVGRCGAVPTGVASVGMMCEHSLHFT
jgi:hypothetical protein